MMSIDKIENSDVNELLEQAEHLTRSKGVRMTPIRRYIYKCLVEADTPLGAYDILGMLDGIGASKPPTVYRSLDWLIYIGLVKKIASTSKYIAASSPNQTALLLCETCGHAEPFDAGPAMKTLESFIKSKGFKEHQTIIEILGQCSEHQS